MQFNRYKFCKKKKHQKENIYKKPREEFEEQVFFTAEEINLNPKLIEQFANNSRYNKIENPWGLDTDYTTYTWKIKVTFTKLKLRSGVNTSNISDQLPLKEKKNTETHGFSLTKYLSSITTKQLLTKKKYWSNNQLQKRTCITKQKPYACLYTYIIPR